MRIKTYTAPTTADAMRMVRDELGDDAIIVSTESGTDGDGVRITAALEMGDGDETYFLDGGELDPTVNIIEQALQEHGTPPRVIEHMLTVARGLEPADCEDLTMAFAATLDSTFAFAPLPERSASHPFILVGPPGSGKTVTAAKLAARSVLKGHKVGLLTTDIVRAGAVEQLTSFTRILELDLKTARGPESLRRTIASQQRHKGLIFVDTPGLNPFDERDMAYLNDLVAATAAEVILVMAAGGDPGEAAEVGEAFAEVGATRLLATRLDTTRRLGAVLSGAFAGRLMFCDVGHTPHISEGLSAITPLSMARLILPPDLEESKTPSKNEVMT